MIVQQSKKSRNNKPAKQFDTDRKHHKSCDKGRITRKDLL